MYCIGIIKPCEHPCGFVEPVFKDVGDDSQYFLRGIAHDGTISSFIPFDGSYPIEENNIDKDANYNSYDIDSPAPLAFIFYRQATPTILIGSRAIVCGFLAELITNTHVEMPPEAKFKAAQYLSEEFLSSHQIHTIYDEYYMHLRTLDVNYAEMWKKRIRHSDGIIVGQPKSQKSSGQVTYGIADAAYEVFIPQPQPPFPNLISAYAACSTMSAMINMPSIYASSVSSHKGLKKLFKRSKRPSIKVKLDIGSQLTPSISKLRVAHPTRKVILRENRAAIPKAKVNLRSTASQSISSTEHRVLIVRKRGRPTQAIVGEKVDIATSLSLKEKTTIVVVD